ncbi:PQQ-dependent sugar dehydrogenase [Pseudoxanthomonas sp. GW2]|uniref:PQQ-dependent sugar dehydrogenase n=1 Tax=Pseudoxanthomonas sp. GW2 TaxID=1211114 RepID=UPI0002DF457C|nr:PQQ-dependent sugar dehydrogenase [Pseudoxanthomonas sp. GW2]
MHRYRLLYVLAALFALLPGPARAQAADGATLFQRNCAGCHGPNREGTSLGPPLSPATYRYGGTRGDIERIIRRGIPSQGMPAFGGPLGEAEINALADFLPTRATTPEEEAPPQPRQSDPVPGVVETLDYAVRAEVFVDGLQTVWSMAFIDRDTALVVERAGRLRVVRNGVLDPRPVAGTPQVYSSSHRWNQGGLLDVALDPDYARNGWIYLSYSHALNPGAPEEEIRAMTRVVRGRIRDHAWVDEEVVFQADESSYDAHAWHYSGRLLFDSTGHLVMPVGDRGTPERARDPADPAGKMHRMRGDGTPAGHPFGREGVLPTIYSIGHRNAQGLALDPETGRIWATEHGPRGGDELNVIRAGGDYGWPVVTYGINYDGNEITPHTRAKGVEQPRHYWRPSIAPAGLAFYRGDEFPLWNGKLLVGTLGRRELRLLTLDGDRVLHEEVIFRSPGRIYEPVVGPDGAIYLCTDDPGQIIRLTAAAQRRI